MSFMQQETQNVTKGQTFHPFEQTFSLLDNIILCLW